MYIAYRNSSRALSGIQQFEALIGILFPLLMLYLLIKLVRKNNTPMLVLERFDLSLDDQENNILIIVGRRTGLMSFIINVLGFDSKTSLQITKDFFIYRSAGLFGEIYTITPLKKLSSTSCGYHKPFIKLIFGCTILMLAIFTSMSSRNTALPAIILCLIGGIFIFLYFYQKRLIIDISETGLPPCGIIFKPSLLDLTIIDITETRKAVSVIAARINSLN